MDDLTIQPMTGKDRLWARNLLAERWGSAKIVTRGRIHQADQLTGLIARYQGQRAGLLTYLIEEASCEIVSLDSIVKRKGVASALLEKVKKIAQASGCERIWLVTTNDNLSALRFYQKRNFRLVAVHTGAIQHSRKLKPSIPFYGMNGIPIRDEIELAYCLPIVK